MRERVEISVLQLFKKSKERLNILETGKETSENCLRLTPQNLRLGYVNG